MNSRSARLRLPVDLLVLAGFCAFLFFFGLNAIGLTGADEPRYAQIAREMLARHDWVTPVLNGQPWLEKPVLYYWEAMLSYSVFGVIDWAARIPAAVNMTALVAGVYFFVRRYWRGVELDAALITASCAAIVGFGHAASTDTPLACAFGLALLAWMTWYKEGHWGWLAGFYVLLALATLAKGPIAPFLAALIIIAFVAARREWLVIRHSLWIPGILLYLAVALPWYVLVQLHTGTFFRVFILEHNLQRYTTTVYRHTQPFWYFGPVLLLALFPWTVLAITALVRAVRHAFDTVSEGAQGEAGNNDIELFLLIWGVLPVIFFSFSGSKLPGYILPAIPAFALLIAVWLRQKLTGSEHLHRLLVLLHALTAGSLLGAALVAPYLTLRLRVPRETLTIAVIAGAAMLAVVALTIHRSGLKALRFVTVLPVVLGLAFLLRMAAPALDDALSERSVAKQLTRLVPSNAPVAVLNVRREVEYGLTFYRNQPVMGYERGEVPAAAHLLVVHDKDRSEIEQATGGRALAHLGGAPRQKLEFYWVAPR